MRASCLSWHAGARRHHSSGRTGDPLLMLLFLGMAAVLVLLGLFITDLDRKRRQLADMLDRVEPLVDRSRRLHLRNMRGSNSSLFYTDNLLDELEHEVTVVERQEGYAPPTDTGRFSLRPGRRYVSLESRIAGLEALSQVEREDAPPAAELSPDPPADIDHDSR